MPDIIVLALRNRSLSNNEVTEKTSGSPDLFGTEESLLAHGKRLSERARDIPRLIWSCQRPQDAFMLRSLFAD